MIKNITVINLNNEDYGDEIVAVAECSTLLFFSSSIMKKQ